ncbi:MAG: CoA pyrophosphatase [Anaerolineae bacterium]|nr:CoA pyrophosphatase [Anaerolineae bacterium]
MRQIHLDTVRAALALENFDSLAAQRQMAPQPRSLRRSPKQPGQSRQAGVLTLLFPAATGLSLVLIRRAENPHDIHSRQIGLPGGAQEPGETPVQTALRETREELGIHHTIDLLGTLTPLYIPPSDFEVHPVVGYVDIHPRWKPDTSEVAGVLECPLAWLLDDNHKVFEDWDWHGDTLHVPWYNVHGHQVWGATAIILSEFEQRVRCVLDQHANPV